MLVFCGGRKTVQHGEKPTEQAKNQQQTQPTYRTRWNLNPGHDVYLAAHSTGKFTLPNSNIWAQKYVSLGNIICLDIDLGFLN